MKEELERGDILWHESVNPPMADGSQCFKAWGYYDPTNWLTDEQKVRWKKIDEILKSNENNKRENRI